MFSMQLQIYQVIQVVKPCIDCEMLFSPFLPLRSFSASCVYMVKKPERGSIMRKHVAIEFRGGCKYILHKTSQEELAL